MGKRKAFTLHRFSFRPEATLGILTMNKRAFHCFTIEKPWKQNHTDQSCIPEGLYVLEFAMHTGRGPKPYKCLAVRDVPGRSAIQIHIANRASELQGCIAPGYTTAVLKGEIAVLNSASAFRDVMHLVEPGDDISLHITTIPLVFQEAPSGEL